MIGYGSNYPLYEHHAGASCPVDKTKPCGWKYYSIDQPNPIVLEGAVVGGPDVKDKFNDKRSDYVQNEVSLNYNAGFQGLAAAVLHLNL